ncbi:pyridoxamine 5'-phosphate oxidase-domain-containing protein [Jimgerdemannia flammicorona]|uniref:Pyridoxamine 5'-phosphate oxidase-domain-containing protein n=1 Tax=Jimgerdemannia flammicorona TaxID=994334 RepID=A0A433QSY9_9FUNG|nr:pyridoxamine 5'-phosphate oxidase-domain-containing protein [Jimgerdemannia flammicorona]
MSNNRASPPWKAVIKRSFAANIKENKQAAYLSLATVRSNGRPANRNVVFRGFAGEEHDGLTEWESDLPVFTTDLRSAKIEQIQQNSWGELSWWFPATGDQFRITGRLHPVAHHDSQIFPSTAVPSHLLTHFNHIDISKSAKALSSISQLIPHKSGTRFSWDAERQRQWQLIPDDIRATYTWPTPGELQSESADAATNPWLSSLEIPEKEKGLFKHLPDKEKGIFKHHESDKDKAKVLEEGFKRFVVLVMEVEEVDHVRLHEKPHTGRTVYKRRDDAGDWSIAGVNP